MSVEIRNADCRTAIRDLEASSVALVLTSPPYDNAREGAYPSVSRDDLEALGVETIRVLKPGGVFVCVIDGPVNGGARSTLAFEMVVRWARLDGWRFLEELMYGRQGQAGEYEGRFRKDHEHMVVFVRDGATHVCDKRAIATPETCGRRVGTVTNRGRGRDGETTARRYSGWAAENGMVMPGTVWNYGSVGHEAIWGHPATFSPRLANDVIRVFSRPGDLVADWFAGSGTTLRAAKDLDRHAIGFEIDPKHCETIRRRLAQDVLPFSTGGAA